jgi:hypothetical protein
LRIDVVYTILETREEFRCIRRLPTLKHSSQLLWGA